ncbi:unnamed protein product [Prorocentrum cordatum]|uniref:Uncharacterized protein n=1 Tax=Prorocentrum cordatum TaxID=2364126 RepID=A0ABN9U1D8_9DINO|nr:unnamed protein product [Polarella glacialis]
MAGRGAARRAALASRVLALWLPGAALAEGPLEPLLAEARARVPSASDAGCELGRGPNFFLTRTSRSEPRLVSLEYAVIESVLFNHPLATVFVLATALEQGAFDTYLREGYCVVLAPISFEFLRDAVAAAEPGLKVARLSWAEMLLRSWLAHAEGSVDATGAATRLYKEYVQRRSRAPSAIEASGCEAVVLPAWVVVEPHFPDGFRAHRDRPDWWLVRSLKLWLPLDYGPPSARNVLPRSVVDLAVRLLSVRLAPYTVGPMEFGPAPAAHNTRTWRTPLDVSAALDNSMAQSLGLGDHKPATPEVALPGEVGGFRTFRDIRVVGRGGCPPDAARTDIRVVLQVERGDTSFYCRSQGRPQAVAAGSPESSAALAACRRALQGSRFELTGSPALVNAALSLLAYWPAPGLGRAPRPRGAEAQKVDARLTDAELSAHFGILRLALHDSCLGRLGEATAAHADAVVLHALVDDVEEQVTVVAHSASRCDLLSRLALSFRAVYNRLPVMVSCECPEEAGESCAQPRQRAHAEVAYTVVVDVPFDFGLSRGKRLLVQLASTEFILVLDDDFVHSPLSCIECMVWHMRSRFHAYPLPFDLLGFPILEDERNFGAFRGRLRAGSGRLFLEPLVSEASLDGCVRVGIHPMAFLARTERMRMFEFQDQLRVGEHEQFFYANRYFGLQAAVCFDSTFPHFRVPMTTEYKHRRERMQELMTSEFQKIGFPGMMYLLHKYDALCGDDHEFIEKDVAPWHISHDTCGPRPNPPNDFAMLFAAVFSSPDVRGAQFRHLLRDGSNAWLSRLSLTSNFRRAFFIEETHPTVPGIVSEEEEFGDIVFMPAPTAEEAAGGGRRAGSPSASQLRFALVFLRDFQYLWLLVAQQDSFVHLEPLYQMLATQERAARTVLGGWQPPPGSTTASALWLPPEFFAVTRDVHHLLASHRVSPWLRTDLKGGDAAAALNAWLAPLTVERALLPGVYRGRRPGECPADAAVLHPVEPLELLRLSDAAASGEFFPCEALAPNATSPRGRGPAG